MHANIAVAKNNPRENAGTQIRIANEVYPAGRNLTSGVLFYVPADDAAKLLELARLRNGCKSASQNRNRSRLSDVCVHYYGLLGEYAVAKYLGAQIDLTISKSGDAGFDLMYHGLRIDVKTTEHAKGKLISRHAGSDRCDAYVLCVVKHNAREFERVREVEIVGWLPSAIFAQRAEFKPLSHNGKHPVYQLEQSRLCSPKTIINAYGGDE